MRDQRLKRILQGRRRHTEVFEGDNGFRFLRKKGREGKGNGYFQEQPMKERERARKK